MKSCYDIVAACGRTAWSGCLRHMKMKSCYDIVVRILNVLFPVRTLNFDFLTLE